MATVRRRPSSSDTTWRSPPSQANVSRPSAWKLQNSVPQALLARAEAGVSGRPASLPGVAANTRTSLPAVMASVSEAASYPRMTTGVVTCGQISSPSTACTREKPYPSSGNGMRMSGLGDGSCATSGIHTRLTESGATSTAAVSPEAASRTHSTEVP